jgi:hypothetical protein
VTGAKKGAVTFTVTQGTAKEQYRLVLAPTKTYAGATSAVAVVTKA